MADGFTAPIERPRHIPSLDGLRALSVLLVIAVHSTQRYGMTHTVPLWVQVLANGGLGVFVFFVISGYLITTLLLRERDKTGGIRLKSFYLRRRLSHSSAAVRLHPVHRAAGSERPSAGLQTGRSWRRP